jgi:acyl-CoA dehydrogenase
MHAQDMSVDQAFRAEVRAFLTANLPDDIRDRWMNGSAIFTKPDDAIRWQKILYTNGWAAPHWPVEHGGTGWSVAQQYAFEMECAAFGAPPVMSTGTHMIGPVLMKFGAQAQKDFFLPRVLACDDYWCQGYSEPGSGSDLASLRTRAVRDGDELVINGSKIWTSHAHAANRIFMLVRTGDYPKPQQGISFLMLPMDTPGITVRPLIMISGDHELNEVFFDNVRVPDDSVVGEWDDGWTIAKYLLEFERGGNFYSSWMTANIARLKHLARVTGADQEPAFQHKLASAMVECEAMNMAALRILSAVGAGQNPGAESSVNKLRGSEISQLLTELTMEAAGLNALPLQQNEAALGGINTHGPQLPEEAEAANRYFGMRAATIMGGTSEVQRNILAKLSLGL